uniref:Beta-1,4-galactosyltransferase 5 n=1 Tax=Sphaerodactylus townsendi TaxID=933632 RepID=A0ACB8F707_9SAUR
MLQRQRLQFAFYVIEQAGNQPFNRAMLFNVGFREAMKDLDWDCLIFHDVDHIPESYRNYYGCGQMPRHFAAKLDKYMYLLPYNEFFGGVSGLTVEQFKKINGFPNAFWGWGGEDDDLWNRVHYAGYLVTRPEGDTGKYKSIPHHHRGEILGYPCSVHGLVQYGHIPDPVIEEKRTSTVESNRVCSGEQKSDKLFGG